MPRKREPWRVVLIMLTKDLEPAARQLGFEPYDDTLARLFQDRKEMLRVGLQLTRLGIHGIAFRVHSSLISAASQ
jgi:hypothetical protein